MAKSLVHAASLTSTVWKAPDRGVEQTSAEFRDQAAHCDRDGSALYAYLLERAAADIESRGPCWRALSHTEGTSPPLRFMGAVHRLVLSGVSPGLATYYPSVGGSVRRDGLWEAFLTTVEDQSQAIAKLATRQVQTNEVGRSRALVGGFFAAVRVGRLPLQLYEIGASAGLNLRWDRYRYHWRDRSWGDPESPVQFREDQILAPNMPVVEPVVVGRSGCDVAPIDAGSDEGRLTLLSFVWADQIDRVERLERALGIARGLPVDVECRPAGPWLRDRLSEHTPGTMSVVFHSIVMHYLSDDERSDIEETIKTAGAGASVQSPLVWLRMEDVSGRAHHATVTMTCWPGGREKQLATAGFHGQNAAWISEP